MKKLIVLIAIIITSYLVANRYFHQEIKSNFSDKNHDASKNLPTGRERKVFFQSNLDNFSVELNQINPLFTSVNKVPNNNILGNVRKILSMDNKNLDKNISTFLKDKGISRSEKISTLLALLDEVGFDSEKGAYFIDVLGSLKPIEIATQLIDKFQYDNLSADTKSRIMQVLANSYGLDPIKATPKIAQFIAQKSISIHDFFTQQIQNPTNKELFRQAITLYPSVSSTDEVEILGDALVKHQDLLTTQESLNIRLDSALATQNIQENNLPQLLNDVQKSSIKHEVKQEFNNRLFSFLKASNADSFIKESAKSSVARYIETQEPVLNNANASFNPINDYHIWLESYAAMSSNQDHKQAFIADFASNLATPIKQAAIVVFADDALISQLRQNSSLQGNLQKELGNIELSIGAKQIIQDALQRLEGKQE